MKEKRLPICRIFTLIALAFLFGVGVASFIQIDFMRSFSILLITLVVFVLILVFNILYKNYLLSLVVLSIICLYLGAGYYSYFNTNLEKKVISLNEAKNITGIIVGKPDRTYNSQKVLVESEISNTKQLLYISLPAYPSCYYGDSVNLSGKIEGADYSGLGRSFKAKKVTGQVFNPTNISCSVGTIGFNKKIIKNLYDWGEKTEEAFSRLLPEPEASFAAGLILGSKRNISDNVSNALSVTGLTHVIALSGYNVTIIIFVLSGLLAGHLGKRKIFWLGFLLILLFVILTGASSSVVRAAIFSLCVIFGGIIGRRGDLTNLMLLAALTMVLFNPFSLIYDVGFQLSFLAFAGLIYLSPILRALFARSYLRLLPEFLSATFLETSSAQLAVFPLILFYFGRFSVIAPLSNLLILWLIPFAMLLAFLVGLLGLIFFPLGKIAVVLAWPILSLIINSILLLAQVPFASFELKKSNPIYLIFYPILLIFTYWLWRKQRNHPIYEKNY